MNKKNAIKIRTLQSLVQKAVNNIDKGKLDLAKSQLADAMRILSMLHQGATCLNKPPAELQLRQFCPFKAVGYVAGQLGLGTITINCRNEVSK